MSTVISPTPGQTVVTTDDYPKREHGHHGHHGHTDWERAILREQAAGFRVASQSHTDTIAAIGNDTEEMLEATGRVSGVVVDAKDKVYGAVKENLQEMLEGFCSVSKGVGEAKDKVMSVVRHGIEEAAEGFFEVAQQVSALSGQVAVGFKDVQATQYQIEGRALLEAAKNASAIQLQATSNFNALTLEATKNAGAASLEASKYANAATLQAQQLAALAAAQLAECCCEMKLMQKDTLAAIGADGDKTRALIQANLIQDLRDGKADALSAYRAAFISKLPPLTPEP